MEGFVSPDTALREGEYGTHWRTALADAVALCAIAERITEFGFGQNRESVLQVNPILLVNLA